MDPESTKKLKRYLRLSPAKVILTLALFLIAAVFFVLTKAAAKGKFSAASAAEFYPAEDSANGTYVYLDVQGLSDYFASRGSDEFYYLAVDRESYGYVLKLTTSDRVALQKQRDWWDAGGDNAPKPGRVYGMARPIGSELADILADTMGLDSRDATFDMFGQYYLDSSQNPDSETTSTLIYVSLLAFIFGIVCLVDYLPHCSRMRKCLKRLKELGLTNAAAEELDSLSAERYGSDVTRLGRNFIYCKGSGAVLALKDILWAYRRVERVNGVVGNESVQAASRTIKAVPVCSTLKRKSGISPESLDRLLSELLERNPAILPGYSEENKKTYSARFREEREKAKTAKENGI